MNEELICQVVEKAVREAGKAVMTLETAKKADRHGGEKSGRNGDRRYHRGCR